MPSHSHECGPYKPFVVTRSIGSLFRCCTFQNRMNAVTSNWARHFIPYRTPPGDARRPTSTSHWEATETPPVLCFPSNATTTIPGRQPVRPCPLPQRVPGTLCNSARRGHGIKACYRQRTTDPMKQNLPLQVRMTDRGPPVRAVGNSSLLTCRLAGYSESRPFRRWSSSVNCSTVA